MSKKLSELTIEIVQRCTNSCIYCSSLSSRQAKKFIEKQKVVMLGAQAVSLGLESISLSGGEPLLHPDIGEIVSVLVELGLSVKIYTTGIIFNEDNGPIIYSDWKKFDKAKVSLIFGIQSTDQSVHDYITRHEGSCELTNTALQMSIKEGFSVEVHIVPNKINLHTLEKTVDNLLEIGVEKISFLRLVVQGFARSYREELILNAEEEKYLKNLFILLMNKQITNKKIRLGIPFSGIVSMPSNCNAGEGKLIIRYDGKILPCEAFKDRLFDDYILGDIDQDSLIDVIDYSRVHRGLMEIKSMATVKETCPAQFLYVNC